MEKGTKEEGTTVEKKMKATMKNSHGRIHTKGDREGKKHSHDK
jgi:hypothetical protein